MYEEIVRQKIILLRREAEITQQELADKIGEERTKIAKLELGLRNPDINIVGKIAKFYDVSIDWIFGEGKR